MTFAASFWEVGYDDKVGKLCLTQYKTAFFLIKQNARYKQNIFFFGFFQCRFIRSPLIVIVCICRNKKKVYRAIMIMKNLIYIHICYPLVLMD